MYSNGVGLYQNFAKANGCIHTNIFQQQTKHPQAVFVTPEQFAIDHFDLLRRQFVSLHCFLPPCATLAANVPIDLLWMHARILAQAHSRIDSPQQVSSVEK
jgi:hypothetical protein